MSRDYGIPEERIRVARAAYFAMCESIDAMIGSVLDALEREALLSEDRLLDTYVAERLLQASSLPTQLSHQDHQKEESQD